MIFFSCLIVLIIIYLIALRIFQLISWVCSQVFHELEKEFGEDLREWDNRSA